MGFPLLVRPLRLAIEAIDRKLEDAAATLGADRLWVFLTVTLPLALPGLIAGMVLCFAKALGEFGATITFVSNIPGETQTISAAIYTFTQTPGGDAAAGRLALVAIVISLASADCGRMARAACRNALPRRLKCSSWMWRNVWASSSSELRFESAGGVTALVRGFRRGQDDACQHDRGIGRPGPWADRA